MVNSIEQPGSAPGYPVGSAAGRQRHRAHLVAVMASRAVEAAG